MVAKLRILIVDDDALVLEVMQAALESEGHVVSAADSGKRAVVLADGASSSGMPFDAVITDIGMPRMDGFELARTLKAKDARLPIIALSGWGHRAADEANANIDVMLAKPPAMAELRKVLSACAEGRKT